MNVFPNVLWFIILDYADIISLQELYEAGWRLKLCSPSSVQVYHMQCSIQSTSRNKNINLQSHKFNSYTGTWTIFDSFWAKREWRSCTCYFNSYINYTSFLCPTMKFDANMHSAHSQSQLVQLSRSRARNCQEHKCRIM